MKNNLKFQVAAGVILIISGIPLLLSNYIKEKRDVVFSQMNLALSEINMSEITNNEEVEEPVAEEPTEEVKEDNNYTYEEYLGIRPSDDALGILQDVHWSDASFGYFPTYALGSALGAQLIKAMEKDIDIDKELEKGNFMAISSWLKDKIQRHGALYTFKEAVVNATGEEFNPQYYVDYLKKKYSELYHIED